LISCIAQDYISNVNKEINNSNVKVIAQSINVRFDQYLIYFARSAHDIEETKINFNDKIIMFLGPYVEETRRFFTAFLCLKSFDE